MGGECAGKSTELDFGTMATTEGICNMHKGVAVNFFLFGVLFITITYGSQRA